MIKYTVKFVLRKEYALKDGTFPVYLQAFLGGKRVRIRMDLSLMEAEWDEKKEMARMKDKKKEMQINSVLSKYRALVDEIFFDARMSGTGISTKMFLEWIETKPNQQRFCDFIAREIENEVFDKEVSTVKSYRTLLLHLKAYNPTASFSEINYEFVQGLDRYLKGKAIGDNARAKYHTLLRKFILLAKKKKRKISNPYEDWKIRSVEVERTWLSVEEVHTLSNLYMSKTLAPLLQQTLRHFLFQIVASVRISDIHLITHEDIEGGLLIFSPQKTKRHRKIVKIPVSALAKELIKDGEGKNGQIFNPPADATTNMRLKEIAVYAGIKKKLTTHVGRHTFGFLYLLMGGKVEELREIMGHSKMETTQVYTHTDHDKKVAGVLKFDTVFKI